MSQPRILMCRPDYFGIEYEINPWMKRQSPADRDQALVQWQDLKQLLQGAGADIELVDPVPGLPDLVFTANAAMIFRHEAILARFRHHQRQGEEPIDESWLAAHGFAVRKSRRRFISKGPATPCSAATRCLPAIAFAATPRGQQHVGAMVGCRVIPLELVDPYYYHLDTCFCPLAAGQAIYFPAAFDNYGRRVLAELIGDLIAVDEQEARRFACNAVVVGRTVVTNTGCPQLHAQLRAKGFQPRETPLDEFVKAGGSAKCLTLRLDGEEAAGWKGKERMKVEG